MRFFSLLLILAVHISTVQADETDYSHKPPSDQIRLKSRVIRFAENLPDDVKVHIKFQGQKQVFGQIRYGSEDSTRVAIVLDQRSDKLDDFVLYADLNRDREITDSELIEGAGRTRQFKLEAEIKRVGPPQRTSRQVTFRRSIDPAIFSVATHGGYASTWHHGGNQLSVWRVDGNANGLFSDVEDEFWIDLDRNGEWSPLGERFPYRSAIKLFEQRFAVRGDRIGSTINFSKISGEGDLKLDFQLAEQTKIVAVKASVYGDDGSAHSIESALPIRLPIGKYTLGQISVKLQRGDEPAWSFSFSHTGIADQQKWFGVEKDGLLEIDPFAQLEFDCSTAESAQAGKDCGLRLILRTAAGLYITGSTRGDPNSWGEARENAAHIFASDTGGRKFGTTTSGFA